jgi:hypothetical protein
MLLVRVLRPLMHKLMNQAVSTLSVQAETRRPSLAGGF